MRVDVSSCRVFLCDLTLALSAIVMRKTVLWFLTSWFYGWFIMPVFHDWIGCPVHSPLADKKLPVPVGRDVMLGSEQ